MDVSQSANGVANDQGKVFKIRSSSFLSNCLGLSVALDTGYCYYPLAPHTPYVIDF